MSPTQRGSTCRGGCGDIGGGLVLLRMSLRFCESTSQLATICLVAGIRRYGISFPACHPSLLVRGHTHLEFELWCWQLKPAAQFTWSDTGM